MTQRFDRHSGQNLERTVAGTARMPTDRASGQRGRATRAAQPLEQASESRWWRKKPSLAVAELAVLAFEGALAAAVVLAVILIGGSPDSRANRSVVGSPAHSLYGSSAVNTLFEGIPQSGTTLWTLFRTRDAGRIVDPQSSYCREFATQVLPTIIREYVRPGILRIRMEPLAAVGPSSTRGQAAELGAAEQDKGFNYAELLYDNQGEETTGWPNNTMIVSVAKSIPGLLVRVLLDARTSAAVRTAQKQVDDLAANDDITRTPTLYVGKTGTKGVRMNLASVTDETTLAAAINHVD